MVKLPEADNLEYIPEDEIKAPSPAVPQSAPRVESPRIAPAAAPDAPIAPVAAPDAPASANWLSGFKQFSWNIRNTRHLFKSGWVRVLDASNGLLLRLRERFKPPEDEEARPRKRDVPDVPNPPIGKRKAPAREKDEQLATKAVGREPRSRLHSLFLVLLGSAASAIAGMIFSYTLLSTMIVNQAQKIDDQMDEISQLGRQYSKILTSEAINRKENQECQKRLEDVESTLANLTAAKRLSSPASSGGHVTESGAGAYPRTTGSPQVSGKAVDCYLGSEGTTGDLARCINTYNQH